MDRDRAGSLMRRDEERNWEFPRLHPAAARRCPALEAIR